MTALPSPSPPPPPPLPAPTPPLTTQVAAALSALHPLTSHPRAPRESRRACTALLRLQSALSLSSAQSVDLLDAAATSDAAHALRDVREVAARADAALRHRPRPRLYAVDAADTQAWGRARARGRVALQAAERRRLQVAANRVETVVQVALWKHRAVLRPVGEGDADGEPMMEGGEESGVRRGRLGRKGRLFSTGDMKRRRWQMEGDAGSLSRELVPVSDSRTVSCYPGLQLYTSEPNAGATASRQESALRALVSLRPPSFNSDSARHAAADGGSGDAHVRAEARRPWEFSLVESPITPLRSRSLAAVPDGEWVMALWRGARVSVKVVRRDRHRFYREGDYLFALGHSPNVPTMLGGYWDHAAEHVPKKGARKHYSTPLHSAASSHTGPIHAHHPRALSRSASSSSAAASPSDASVGYLILEVANGVSLDKLVRDGKLADTVTQIRVLDRVVAALVYAQTQDPLITHQDIHPGNILLVPSPILTPSDVALAHTSQSSHLSTTSASLDIDTSSTSSDRHLTTHVGIPPTTTNSISTVGGNNSDKSTVTTVDFNSTAIDILDPSSPLPIPQVVSATAAGAHPDIVIDEFGSPQKKSGPTGAFVSQSKTRPGGNITNATAIEPKFPKPTTLLPHIPKVEEVTEALTVLERVALHNELDASVDSTVARAPWKSPSQRHSTPNPNPVVSLEKQKLKRASSCLPAREKSENGPAVGMTTTTPRTKSASKPTVAKNMETTTNPPAPNREDWLHSNESLTPTIAPFTVKIMDFASASEAAGTRKKMSWNSNSTIAGYCPPEKATTSMWRKLYQAREKERERSRDRGRRAMVGRSSANGRQSPRTHSQPRRGSSNGMNGTAGLPGGRSSGSSGSNRRKAYDSETHALFADDNLDDYADTEDDGNFDSLGHMPISSLTDRSGRRVAAKSPEFLREDLRVRSALNDQSENGRTAHVERSSSDGVVRGHEHTFEDGMLVKDWNISSEGDTNGGGIEWQERISKIDVWSIGGLLYYMSTGSHPPRDAWARQSSFLDGKEGRNVPVELKELIQVCMQRDPKQRVCMRDVKRHIDSVLQGLMFARGLSLLKTDRKAAFLLLDKAVGIRYTHLPEGESGHLGESASTSLTASNPGEGSTDATTNPPRGEEHRDSSDFVAALRKGDPTAAVGLSDRTRAGLACLPLVVVRRVEWEAAARYLRRSEKELSLLRRALVMHRWTKSDVTDGPSAISYLRTRASEGVVSAQSALGWIYRWGAGGVKKDITEARRLWHLCCAKDAEASNGLGLLYHHGRDTQPPDGTLARRHYETALSHGYTAAAVNLGVMLHDGAAGMPVDGRGAQQLYETAVRHGDAIAANNLALLLQHGADGVERDAAKAVRMYEVAIERGERHHACRNLAELLWNGADGVKRARANAVEYFAEAVRRGDEGSRRLAREKVRKLVQGDGVERALRERCWRVVEGA